MSALCAESLREVKRRLFAVLTYEGAWVKIVTGMGDQVGSKNGRGKPNITWRVVDGEALILDLNTGFYFSLNPVATEIWEALQSGAEIPRILETVSSKYRIEAQVVERDLHELMTDLRSCRLWE